MTPPAPGREPRVLFRVAAGPRLGYGHLIRCSRLAESLGVTWHLSLRGGGEAARVARRLGARLERGTATRLGSSPWDAWVVDDPNAAAGEPWVRAAHRAGLLVASIHDLGLGARGADIVIDGTMGAPRRRWPGGRWHTGPRHMILDRRVRDLASREARSPRERQVLVALGGGPRLSALWRLAAELVKVASGRRLVVAPGMRAVSERWRERFCRLGVGLADPDSFLDQLRRSELAVLGGGVSLYEASALGTPAVAVAVVAAQLPTVRAFARTGLAVAGGRLQDPGGRPAAARVARLVGQLLMNPARRRSLSRAGRTVIDGAGADRVAAVLRDALAERQLPAPR